MRFTSLPTDADKNESDAFQKEFDSLKETGAKLPFAERKCLDSNYSRQYKKFTETQATIFFIIVYWFFVRNTNQLELQYDDILKKIDKKRREMFHEYRSQPKETKPTRAQFEKTLEKFDFTHVKKLYDTFYHFAGSNFETDELKNYITIHIMSTNATLINMFKTATLDCGSDENQIFIVSKIKMYFDYFQSLDYKPYAFFINKAFIDFLMHTYCAAGAAGAGAGGGGVGAASAADDGSAGAGAGGGGVGAAGAADDASAAGDASTASAADDASATCYSDE